MTNEMQRVWEALRAIYGMDLTAATLVVLTRTVKLPLNSKQFTFRNRRQRND